MATEVLSVSNEKKRKSCDEVAHAVKRAPKGFWTPNEDLALFSLLQARNMTPVCWQEVANYLPGRTSKQCRERWNEHLNPNVDHTAFTEEEDAIILQAQLEMGNKWKDITKRIRSQRTSTSIKVRWHHLQRRLASLHKLELSLSALTHINDHMTVVHTNNSSSNIKNEIMSNQENEMDFDFDDDLSLIEALDCCSSSTTSSSFADYSSDDYFLFNDC